MLDEDSSAEYVRIAQLARILGWERTKAYYWVSKCPDVEVVQFAGLRMVRAKELPRIVMRLRSAREEAMAKRGYRD